MTQQQKKLPTPSQEAQQLAPKVAAGKMTVAEAVDLLVEIRLGPMRRKKWA